jgi:predicted phage replisome organizer
LADVKWIKIVTDIFDDEKVRLIDALPDNDAILVIWFKLLTQAGKSNQNGALFINSKLAYTDEMLATIFNRKLATVRLALDTFEKLDMIERGDYIQIANWEKHQNIEGMEKIRLQTRERVAKHREKQKQITQNNDVALSNVTVTHLEEELDIEEDIDKDIKNIKNSATSKSTTSRFTPPTLDQVKNYCDERSNSVDADRFINFYSSKGWMVGKNKMKDWKAAVRTWEDKPKSDSKYGVMEQWATQ